MLESVKMSYFGIKVKHRTYGILVRIHGPLDRFEISPIELEKTSLEFLNSLEEKFNMLDASHGLANYVAENYCNNDTRLWVEVEIDSGSKMICGSSVAKVDVAI